MNTSIPALRDKLRLGWGPSQTSSSSGADQCVSLVLYNNLNSSAFTDKMITKWSVTRIIGNNYFVTFFTQKHIPHMSPTGDSYSIQLKEPAFLFIRNPTKIFNFTQLYSFFHVKGMRKVSCSNIYCLQSEAFIVETYF